MRALSVLALGLLALASAHDHSHGGHDHDHGGEPTDEHTDVVVLTGDVFDAQVKGWPLSLIEFYAPWCGHCKRLAPEYEAAAHNLFGKVTLAKMDCTAEENKDTCSKYGVQGYPTLKVFRNDGSEPTPYEGGRTADEITKFMKKQTEPAFQVLKTAEELKAVTDADFTVIGFFAAESGKDYDEFVAAANKLRNDYSFVVTTNAKLAAEHKTKVPGVAIVKDFDEKHAVKAPGVSVESFVKAEAFPAFGEIGPENYAKYMERGLPLAWAFLDYSADNNKDTEAFLAKLGVEFKGKVSFVKLDGVRWAEHAKTFGITSNPGLCIQNPESKKMFKLTGEFTEASIRAHTAGVLDGSVLPTVKSQPVPESQDGPVYVLVGKTFEQIAHDPTKDVMVEFYAPWCGHCKSLAPKYDKLAEELKEFPSIVVAKIDSTENDTPEDISGFPTLKFYRADNTKTAIDYNGDRTTDAMLAFIKEHALSLKKEGGAAHSHEEL